MSKINVNEIGTQSGTDVAISSGKTVSGTASQFKMTDLVAGDVLYASADDTVGRLAKGTAAQSLIMNAGATAPEWTSSSGAKIGQVLQTGLTTTFSTTSTSFTPVTGLQQAITPAASTSKFLVSFTISGCDGNTYSWGTQIKRQITGGSNTAIAIGTTATGNRTNCSTWFQNHGTRNISTQSFTFLDSPATGSIVTYVIEVKEEGSTLYINRDHADNDSAYTPRTMSQVTVMEILP